VKLAWWLDPDRRTVYIYQTGRESETLNRAATLKGDGPDSGFVLDLRENLEPDI